MTATADSLAGLSRIFVMALDAAPGATYWGVIRGLAESPAGLTPAQLAGLITGTPQFQSVYPPGSDAAFASVLVARVLGSAQVSVEARVGAQSAAEQILRDARSAGQGEAAARATLINAFADYLGAIKTDPAQAGYSASQPYLAVARQLANKVAVADYYSTALKRDVTDIGVLREALVRVSDKSAVVTASGVANVPVIETLIRGFDEATQQQLYRAFVVALDAAPGATYWGVLKDLVEKDGLGPASITGLITTTPQFQSVYPTGSDGAFASALVGRVLGNAPVSAEARSTALSAAEQILRDARSAGQGEAAARATLINAFADYLGAIKTDPAQAGYSASQPYLAVARQLANKVAVADFSTETLKLSETSVAALQKTLEGTSAGFGLIVAGLDTRFVEGAGAGVQAAAASLFAPALVAAPSAGQTVTRISLSVSGLADGVHETLRVDGTTIGLAPAAGQASVVGVTTGNALSYSVSLNQGTATLVLSKASGISSQTAESLISGLRYQNTKLDDPTAGLRKVQITQLQEGSSTGGAVAGGTGGDVSARGLIASVAVVPLNDAPVVTLTASNPGLVESSVVGQAAAPVRLFSAASVSAVEAGQTITQLSLTVRGVVDGVDEKLVLDGTAISLALPAGQAQVSGTTVGNALGYTVSAGAGLTTVTLSKAAGISASTAQALLEAASYQHAKVVNPTGGARVITLTQVKDSGGTVGGGSDAAVLSLNSTVTVKTSEVGRIQDGYISGATVFADADGDGVLDPGEASTTSDAQGRFSLSAALGNLVATGGTDISTNLPHATVLRAPAGAAIVNPLTTLVSAVADQLASQSGGQGAGQGASAVSAAQVREAEQQVAQKLGLPAATSLTTLDPLVVAGSATATAAEKAAAVSVYKASALVANVLTQTAAAVSSASGSGGSGGTAADAQAAAAKAAAAVAQLITSAAATATVDLSNAQTLKTVLTESAKGTAAQAKVAAVADQLTAVMAATNAEVAKVVVTGTDVGAALQGIVKAQVVAQGAAATALAQAVTSGQASALTTSFTGAALTSQVSAAATGTIGEGIVAPPLEQLPVVDTTPVVPPPVVPPPVVDTTPPVAPTLVVAAGAAQATAAEATAGAISVTGESGASITVRLVGTGDVSGSNTVTKIIAGSGSAQAVTLSASDLTKLGDGTVAVTATQTDAAGNAQTAAAATTSFTLDTTAPLAPTIAVVAGAAQATAAEVSAGAVSVTGESGASITVRLVGKGDVTKTITGSGSAQAVTLDAADLTTLGDGTVTVTATQTDAAGNAQTAAAATASFTLDTVRPVLLSTSVNRANQTLTLTYDSPLSSQSAPTSAFSVQTVIGGVLTDNAVSSVTVSGSTVVLGLASAFEVGQVSLRYAIDNSSDQAQAVQDLAGNDALAVSSGVVADGYLRGAAIWVYDSNSSSTLNGASGWVNTGITTGPNGEFFLPASFNESNGSTRAMQAVGGVNIDTGVPNTVPLKTPAGSTTVNPLTTLVETVRESAGVDAASASTLVAAALGLSAGTDLTRFNPLAVLVTNPGDQADSASVNAALAAHKAAASVATLVALTAGGDASNAKNAIASLATQLRNAATEGRSVSLTDASVLGAVATAAGANNTNTNAALDALAAISTATDLSKVSQSQAVSMDKVTPSVPTALASVEGSNGVRSIRVNLDTSAQNGSAVVVGDRLDVLLGTLTGGVFAGTTVAGSLVLTASEVAQGFAQVPITLRLAQGAYSFAATLSDQAGNTSQPSTALGLTIGPPAGSADTVAPPAPVINQPIGGNGTINAAEAADGVVIGGTAESGSQLKLSFAVGGSVVRTVVREVDGAGTWAYKLSPGDLKVLGQSSVSVSAVATDAAGNVSAASGAQSFTIDMIKPTLDVPTLGGAGGAATSTTVNGVVFSKEAAPTLTLKAEAGSSIAIDWDNNGGADTTVAATGSDQSVSLPSPATDGSRAISVRASDAAGNTTDRSITFTLDRVAPSLDDALLTSAGKLLLAFSEPIKADETTIASIIADLAPEGGKSLGLNPTGKALNPGSGSKIYARALEITLGAGSTLAANDTLTLNSAASVRDAAGNLATSKTVPVAATDNTAPKLTISATPTTLGRGQQATVTFSFDEAVRDFVAGDVVITGGGQLGPLVRTSPIAFTAVYRLY